MLYTQTLQLCVTMAAGTPSHVGAGSVQIDSSAKPLVPYPVGISGQGPARQPSRSRLANTASAEEGMHQQCFRLPHSHCPLLGLRSHALPLAITGSAMLDCDARVANHAVSKLCYSLLTTLLELIPLQA